MNYLDIDAGLAGVLDLVRERYAPVGRALAENQPINNDDLAHLAGAVRGLLGAIDARLPKQTLEVAA